MPEKSNPRAAGYHSLAGWTTFLAISLLILTLAGCRSSTPVSPSSPTPSSPPARVSLPTTTPPSGAARGEAMVPETLSALASMLGPDWAVEVLTGEVMAAMGDDFTVAGDAVVVRYAPIPDDLGAPEFTVLVTPRAELSLKAYVAQVAATLTATGGVETGGVSVVEHGLDYSLREDGIPAALIRFQADGTLFGAQGIGVEGIQAAVLDAAATNFMVVTLTSDKSRSDQLQPLLIEVVNELVGVESGE